MLKNLSPLLSGGLLTVLDDMSSGDSLVLMSVDFPVERLTCPVIPLGAASTEAAVDAILSVVPLDAGTTTPIAFHDAGPVRGDLPDVAFAVSGIASDAELRRVGMLPVDAADFDRLSAAATVAVAAGLGDQPYAFVIRRG